MFEIDVAYPCPPSVKELIVKYHTYPIGSDEPYKVNWPNIIERIDRVATDWSKVCMDNPNSVIDKKTLLDWIASEVSHSGTELGPCFVHTSLSEELFELLCEHKAVEACKLRVTDFFAAPVTSGEAKPKAEIDGAVIYPLIRVLEPVGEIEMPSVAWNDTGFFEVFEIIDTRYRYVWPPSYLFDRCKLLFTFLMIFLYIKSCEDRSHKKHKQWWESLYPVPQEQLYFGTLRLLFQTNEALLPVWIPAVWRTAMQDAIKKGVFWRMDINQVRAGNEFLVELPALNKLLWDLGIGYGWKLCPEDLTEYLNRSYA